jgi:hypothetical protein
MRRRHRNGSRTSGRTDAEYRFSAAAAERNPWAAAGRASGFSRRRATVVCSRTRAAALPTGRPVCNARVPHAIG